MRTGLILSGILVGALGGGQAYAQSAGIVQFAAGDVKVVAADGAERVARKGVPVNVGDTVLSAAGALAQLKMGDGAIVVVQPQSRLTVAEFRYAGVEDGTEKVRYRLEQGGFRAITGAIGRTHKHNYLIETPIAHMGVRGTDHESYYFPASGPLPGDGAKPGAFNKVNTGRTFMRTGSGEVVIDPNQVGFVASANDLPVILAVMPAFFNHAVAPRSARPAVNPAPAATQFAKVEKPVETEDGEKLVRPRGQSIDVGTGKGALTGYAVSNGKSAFGRSGNGLTMAPSSGATFAQKGEDRAFEVSWGTWAGDAVKMAGRTAVGPVHVINSTMKTSADQLAALPSSVTKATYQHSGGSVSNYLGMAGKIDKLEVSVNFAKQMITNYELEATVIGEWKAKGSGSFARFTGTSGIQLSGKCAGCSQGGGATSVSGTAHGAFVGPNAEKMISTFGLTSSGQAISGSGYLSR
jgi:hypothetical protein